ncbi:hypothetical protein [Hydrocarboniphaga effusa]|uniref:hypothetical protein n=1 Tax=Hydrocarboniphaga effusa TaxID=243629 RepID=UPI003BAB0C40
MDFQFLPASQAEFIDAAIQAGERSSRYRPSNGTEGDFFMSAFCFRCSHFGSCSIHLLAMAEEVDSPAYPEEWTFDHGHPTCTAFAHERETWEQVLDEISGIDSTGLACA